MEGSQFHFENLKNLSLSPIQEKSNPLIGVLWVICKSCTKLVCILDKSVKSRVASRSDNGKTHDMDSYNRPEVELFHPDRLKDMTLI